MTHKTVHPTSTAVQGFAAALGRALWGGRLIHRQGSARCAVRPPPTRSRGISRNSEPCFKKTFPAVCAGFIPIPSLVIMALVAAGTLNSSAANFRTAVKGVLSGTLNLRQTESLSTLSKSVSPLSVRKVRLAFHLRLCIEVPGSKVLFRVQS